MPVYTSPEGQKVWFGKSITICGLVASISVTALGGGMAAWTLSDLMERYQENYIPLKEALRLFIEGGLGLYISYVAIEDFPEKLREWQRLREFERQKGRRIQGDDYPSLYR